MKSRWLPLLLGISAAAACLPDGEPVDGRLLFPGTAIEDPAFESCSSSDPWVAFAVRKSLPVNGYGGRVDLHRVRWSDGQDQLLFADLADRESWAPVADAQDVRYYMKDERPGQGVAAVGTL